MKCEFCPLAPPLDADGYADACGIADSELGTTWKDGKLGCRLSPKTIYKKADEYERYLGIIGLEMGLEMDLEHHGISLETAVEHAKHMVGLDGYGKTYTRKGKKYYKPYRNYWDGEDPALELMSHKAFGLVENHGTVTEDGSPYYRLTREGLDWLGRRLSITIRDPQN